MEKVYITKANFRSIAYDASHVVYKNEIEDIYRLNLSTILATPELKVLSALKMIISSTDDPVEFINLNGNHASKTQEDKNLGLYI